MTQVVAFEPPAVSTANEGDSIPGIAVLRLSHDLLLRIEEYLPVPALKIVCRHWWVSLPRPRLHVTLSGPKFYEGWRWLAQQLPQLHTLHLQLHRPHHGPQLWDLSMVVERLAAAPQLEVLQLNLLWQRLQGELQPLQSLTRLPALRELTLNLGLNWLQPEDAEVLSLLTHCRQLRSLDLNVSDSKVADAGCAALSRLATLPALQSLTLNLERNGIGSEGTAALAVAVAQATGLRRLELDLAANAVGATLPDLVLACGHVEDLCLNLQGNQLSTTGLTALSALGACGPARRTLVLNVADTGLQAGAGPLLAPLGRCTALTTLLLELGFNELGDGDMEALFALQSCRSLQKLQIRLEGNAVGPAGVAHLTRAALALPALRLLDLGLQRQDQPDFAPQGPHELARLAQHPGLTGLSLDVRDNDLQPGHAIPLAAFEHACPLQYLNLDLCGNRLGTEDAAALGRAARAPALHSLGLQLRATQLGAEGLRRLAEGVAANGGLRYLELDVSDVDLEEGSAAALEALRLHPRMREFDLYVADNRLGDLDLPALGALWQMPRLECLTLDLQGNAFLGDVATLLPSGVSADRWLRATVKVGERTS